MSPPQPEGKVSLKTRAIALHNRVLNLGAKKSVGFTIQIIFHLPCSSWLGKLLTCGRHVGPTAKSWHIWPTGPQRADTNIVPDTFFVSGIARSNHRTNWYVSLNNSFSQVTCLHPSHIMVTARRATATDWMMVTAQQAMSMTRMTMATARRDTTMTTMATDVDDDDDEGDDASSTGCCDEGDNCNRYNGKDACASERRQHSQS